MGSHDDAEVCELVGIYLLGKLSNIIDRKNIGLYRDDWFDRLRKDNCCFS